MAQLIAEMTVPRAMMLLFGFAFVLKLVVVLANARKQPPQTKAMTSLQTGGIKDERSQPRPRRLPRVMEER